MNWIEILKTSYNAAAFNECPPESRLEWLGEYIFDFTTYDGNMSALFARKAIEVCSAINNKTTFLYIEDSDNYQWFLIMCNMPFFADKLEWGSSIRGAWWDNKIEFQSCGLWVDDEQLCETEFTLDEWKKFITAIIDFATDIDK